MKRPLDHIAPIPTEEQERTQHDEAMKSVMRNYDPNNFSQTVTKPGKGEIIGKGDTIKFEYSAYIHGLGRFESS